MTDKNDLFKSFANKAITNRNGGLHKFYVDGFTAGVLFGLHLMNLTYGNALSTEDLSKKLEIEMSQLDSINHN